MTNEKQPDELVKGGRRLLVRSLDIENETWRLLGRFNDLRQEKMIKSVRMTDLGSKYPFTFDSEEGYTFNVSVGFFRPITDDRLRSFLLEYDLLARCNYGVDFARNELACQYETKDSKIKAWFSPFQHETEEEQ